MTLPGQKPWGKSNNLQVCAELLNFTVTVLIARYLLQVFNNLNV